MDKIDLSKIKKVHLIGIGGIAVSADAKFLIGIGKIVTGSDAHDSEIVREVEKKGATVYIGHKARNLDKHAELVIYSPAVPFDNAERAKARKMGIREMSHTQFLGYLSRQMKTIAVSGTNGKSTTTAMLGLILEKAGIDPTVILGSKVQGFDDGNLRINTKLREKEHEFTRKSHPFIPSYKVGEASEIFVVEGCEYKAGMLELSPEIIALTNIEEDHLDYYKNLQDIKRVFKKYVMKVEKGGVVIFNADDKNSVDILEKFNGNKVSYGIKKELRIKNQELSNKKLETRLNDIHIGQVINLKLGKQGINSSPLEGGKGGVKRRIGDIIAKDIRIKNKRQVFDAQKNSKKLGEIKLRVPGVFNVYNALAATAAALELGVEFKIIKKALEEFKGIWRRFEIVGDYNGAVIISDYAHHPTAIRGTIKAAREFYPNRRIIAVFQPHSYNRTRKLFNEFVSSFDEADFAVLPEVYAVEGRENENDKISSKQLADAVRQYADNRFHQAIAMAGCRLHSENVLYAKDLKETGKILRKKIKKNDVVLLMGAGDIYKLEIGN